MFRFSHHHDFDLLHGLREKKSVFHFLPSVRRRHRLKKAKKFSFWLGVFIVPVFCFFAVLVLAYGDDVLHYYQSFSAGRARLEYALSVARKKDYSSARESAKEAQVYFSEAKEDIEKMRSVFLLGRLPLISSTLYDLSALSASANRLSKALDKGAIFASIVDRSIGNDKVFRDLTRSEREHVISSIVQALPELQGMKAEIELALIDLNSAEFGGIMSFASGRIKELRQDLEKTELVLANAVSLAELTPYLLGYPERSDFLVLFQNDAELRPAGGFIGTYGILSMEAGLAVNVETHDIYHMDMPASLNPKFRISPPRPIRDHLNKDWYMRDSNWSPDFPSSAEQVLWFYEQESKAMDAKSNPNKYKGKIEGVLAINPKVIEALLFQTGPVTVAGQTYSRENFSSLLQEQVEIDYTKKGISQWDRKNVIGEILKELELRLSVMPLSELAETMSVFSKNLASKDLIFYFRDSAAQETARSRSWTAELGACDDDCLMVVDANLASLKTDSVIERLDNYRVNKTGTERVSDLSLTWTNKGTAKDWRTSDYGVYTRVYAPLGSELLSAKGIDLGQVQQERELGYQVFGFWHVVPLASQKMISLSYKLPSVQDKDRYMLKVIKQSGRQAELSFTYMSSEPWRSFSPLGLSVKEKDSDQISWSSNLDRDLFFEIKN